MKSETIMSEAGPIAREELYTVMRKGYDDLIDFVTTPEFKSVYAEMASLPPEDRPEYVESVLLNEEKLQEKGVVVPEDILIQRSTFGDRRPTLFCVKKYLPEKYHDLWENVNWTFDNEYNDEEISREPDLAWRNPLPVELHHEALKKGIDLEDIPGVDLEDIPSFVSE